MIAVIVVTDNGLNFQGIYSSIADAETIGLTVAHLGEVLLMSFDLTVTDKIDAERGVYNSNPQMKVIPIGRSEGCRLQ